MPFLLPVLVGSAATTAGVAGATATAAATSGIFGTAGAFAIPQTLATLGSTLSLLSGIGGMQAGNANAAIAKAEGNQALAAGRAEANRIRARNAATQSTFMAGAGAQGTTFEGSPMLAYLENAKQGELEAQDALYSGRIKASSLKMQADIYKRQGTSSLIGGLAKGLGSLGSTLLK